MPIHFLGQQNNLQALAHEIDDGYFSDTPERPLPKTGFGQIAYSLLSDDKIARAATRQLRADRQHQGLAARPLSTQERQRREAINQIQHLRVSLERHISQRNQARSMAEFNRDIMGDQARANGGFAMAQQQELAAQQVQARMNQLAAQYNININNI